jgi:hypothetical protein
MQSKSKAGSSQSQPAASPSAKVAIALPNAGAHPTSVTNELKSQPASPEFEPSLVQTKAGSKSSDDSVSSLIVARISDP